MKLTYVDIYEFSNHRALCLLWLRTHLDSPSDIHALLRSSLEDIRGNPSGGLWHLSTYRLCPFTCDPESPCSSPISPPPIACGLRSHPRLRRSRGPVPDLRGWRQQLRYGGGTLQQLASWRRYEPRTLQHHWSHGFFSEELLPLSSPCTYCNSAAVLISLVGGGECCKVDLEMSPHFWESY